MPAKQAKVEQQDYNFFVNEETPNYWKFAFFLIRNIFKTSKIILVSIIIALFLFGPQIWNVTSSAVSSFSMRRANEDAAKLQDKLSILQQFNQDAPQAIKSIQDAYLEIETIRNNTEAHIRKLEVRSGKKETLLSELNNKYQELVAQLNSHFEQANKVIALARNPNPSALKDIEISTINYRIEQATAIQQGKSYHGLKKYAEFMSAVNNATTY